MFQNLIPQDVGFLSRIYVKESKLNKNKHIIPSKEKSPTKTYVVQDSDCEGAAEGLSNFVIPEMNNTSQPFIPKVVSVSR